MKKKIITIGTILLIAGSIGFVLANNKAKINEAAKPVKDNAVIPVKVFEVKEDFCGRTNLIYFRSLAIGPRSSIKFFILV